MSKVIFFLYLLGLILICMEIYIPGGIVGTLGLLALLSAVTLSFITFGAGAGLVMLLFTGLSLGIALYFAFKYFPGTKIGKKFFLNKQIGGDTDEQKDKEGLTGKKGIALTDLRPSGTAKIDEKRRDVVTQGDYIEKGQEIEIIEVDGNRIVVRSKKE